MSNKFAVGAILVHEVGPNGASEEIKVELVEADSPELALGKFFFKLMGKEVMVREFKVDGDMSPANDTEIRKFLAAGQKISAILRLRQMTDLGLKEAKDIIEGTIIPQLKKEGVIPDGIFDQDGRLRN